MHANQHVCVCANKLTCLCFSHTEMNYEMLAEIDDEIGDLHILDTANTVRIEYINHLCVHAPRKPSFSIAIRTYNARALSLWLYTVSSHLMIYAILQC